MVGLILKPFNLCSITYFRLFNICCSIINYLLMYQLALNKYKISDGNSALLAFSVGVTPPILFFDNLFYTETLAATFILSMVLFQCSQKYKLSAMFGLFSIFIRQTNVIWVFYVFVNVFFEQLTLKNIRSMKAIFDYFLQNTIKCTSYIFVLLLFICFIILNKGVAIGDRQAHQITIHLPQLFYFAFFVVIFNFVTFIKDLIHIRKIHYSRALCSILVISLILYKNIQIHPYLLADNRHYTFYFWKYFGRLQSSQLCLSSMAHFISMSLIHRRLASFNQNLIPLITYYFCVTLSLALHSLIEIRYFFIPLILLKFQLRESARELMLQIIISLLIHVFVMFIFVTKDIYWNNFENVQRLGW